MADFFKSALGYLGSSGINQDNSFVGQYVELGDQKLRVKKVIAEGGFPELESRRRPRRQASWNRLPVIPVAPGILMSTAHWIGYSYS